MFVAWISQRADHPAHFLIDLGKKCTIADIAQNRFQSTMHFGGSCVVTEFAHERGKCGRIGQFCVANSKHSATQSFAPLVPQEQQELFETCRNRFVHGRLVGMHDDLRIFRHAVGSIDSGEFADLAGTRFLYTFFGLLASQSSSGD